MNLSPPSQVTLILAVLLAVLALLVRYAGVAIPVVSGRRQIAMGQFLKLAARSARCKSGPPSESSRQHPGRHAPLHEQQFPLPLHSV